MARGGHQLGSQHSHSLEVHFVHTPGLKVVYPATPADAKALLKSNPNDLVGYLKKLNELAQGYRSTPAGEEAVIEDIVRDRMENVCDLKVPLKVHLGWGPNWADAK